jgi:pullulanase
MEFLRSKQGIENSYNSPDSINSVDWDVKDKYIFVTDYIKNLIKIRKKHPSFRLSTLEEITNKLQFLLDVPRNVVAFTIKNDDKLEAWKNILVIYNANRNAVKINLPNLKWNLVVDKYIIDENTIETCTNNYTAEGISISILYSV